MRQLPIIAAILLLSGCRTPQSAFQAQIHSSSNQPIVFTTEVVESQTRVPHSVESLVEQGLANNPKILEAEHRIRSLTHRIPQELALPDPMLNTATHLSPVETAAGRQAFSLGINQKFVDVDRRATRAAVVHEEIASAQADLNRVRQELAEQIRIACYQLMAVQQTMTIISEDIESLAQIEAVVLQQYEVDQNVSQQDVLQVQVQQSSVENQLTVLRQRERSLNAKIARLTKAPIGSNLKLESSLAEVHREKKVEELLELALSARPELESQLALIRRDRHKIDLAHLEHRPDITMGLNWIATSSNGISPVANGDDALILGIGFNLPIHQDRIRAAKCEATESYLASQTKFETIEDEIAEQVIDTVSRLDSAETTTTLLRSDIIPKTERSLELSIEEYSNGKSDFNQLISNWRSVLQQRIALADLQSQQMQLMATLTRQVGSLVPLNQDNEVAHHDQPNFEPVNEPQPAASTSSPTQIDNQTSPQGNQ